MKIKSLNENDLVCWSIPKRIKNNWFNAIIEKPMYATRNIQFIMRCNYNELSYIVVSVKFLTKDDIEKIKLDDYIFDNRNPAFCKGLPYKKEGAK